MTVKFYLILILNRFWKFLEKYRPNSEASFFLMFKK